MVILLVITYALYYYIYTHKCPEEIFNLLFPARTTRLKRIVRLTEHCTEDGRVYLKMYTFNGYIIV